MSSSKFLCVVQNQILTTEANVYLPSKLAIFTVNGKAEIVKMDFLHNGTTLLYLFVYKNDVTHSKSSCGDFDF